MACDHATSARKVRSRSLERPASGRADSLEEALDLLAHGLGLPGKVARGAMNLMRGGGGIPGRLRDLRDRPRDILGSRRRLLDIRRCRCTRYAERQRFVPNCEQLRPDNIRHFPWLPSSCAYRLLAEGRELPWWHHLASGDPELVHRVGASVRGRAVSERRAGPLEHHIVTWPA